MAEEKDCSPNPAQTLSVLRGLVGKTEDRCGRNTRCGGRCCSVFREMDVARGMKALLQKLNQKDGYDCPAAPGRSDDERSTIAEYCENGAKAIAEEATTRKLGPEFFAANSVAALRNSTTTKSERRAGSRNRCFG